jgi:hypothetical protein
MVTTKRQLSFYAESDVDLYLSYMTQGSKTAILNEAIRGRMRIEAMVDLNDGKKAENFGLLSDADQAEVHSNLILEELALRDVDDHIWTIVQETASPNWKDNTRRYLTLHEAKFKEPFRIKKMRSQEERDEYRRNRPAPQTKYYCDEHAPKLADVLTGVNFGELTCSKCGRAASYREYK